MLTFFSPVQEGLTHPSFSSAHTRGAEGCILSVAWGCRRHPPSSPHPLTTHSMPPSSLHAPPCTPHPSTFPSNLFTASPLKRPERKGQHQDRASGFFGRQCPRSIELELIFAFRRAQQTSTCLEGVGQRIRERPLLPRQQGTPHHTSTVSGPLPTEQADLHLPLSIHPISLILKSSGSTELFLMDIDEKAEPFSGFPEMLHKKGN